MKEGMRGFPSEGEQKEKIEQARRLIEKSGFKQGDLSKLSPILIEKRNSGKLTMDGE